MTTYTLVVSEDESPEEIRAEVREETGTIADSTRVAYDDYGLIAEREGWTPEDRRKELTADVTSLRLQSTRDGEAFAFRLVGDGELLAEERVTDDDWRLAET